MKRGIVYWLGHPALGAFTVFIGERIGWIPGAAFAWMYVRYQRLEERKVGDRAFEDVRDYMIGFGVGAAFACLLKRRRR
jgi:hypothetical protein